MRDICLSKVNELQKRFQEWRGKYFPERQLFLRSEGRVRFLTIGSYTQLAASTATVIALVWGAVTTFAFFTRDLTLEEKEQAIASMSAQYEALSTDFSTLEQEVERRALQLEERQKFLEEIIEKTDTSALTRPVADLETIDPETSEETEPQSYEAPQEKISQLDRVEKRKPSQLTFLENMIGVGKAEAAAFSNVDRRKHLLQRLENMEERQRNLANYLLAKADQQIRAIDTVLKPTSLDQNKLVAQFIGDPSAMGGPYVPEQGFEPVFTPYDSLSFSQLQDTYLRLEMVTNVLNSFPIGEPAENYYLSSRFGRRKDPLKKTWANHPGLDLAGWPGTAIYATAPGKVVHAGWYGPYGKMVEIEHGNGFKTRYGHMRKVRVKEGDEVTLGQRVGDMGKTGRVTGTHLHYEIWFEGSVRDPMPFMKAASDVREIQKRYAEAQ